VGKDVECEKDQELVFLRNYNNSISSGEKGKGAKR
jgi:hypothetical protein